MRGFIFVVLFLLAHASLGVCRGDGGHRDVSNGRGGRPVLRQPPGHTRDSSAASSSRSIPTILTTPASSICDTRNVTPRVACASPPISMCCDRRRPRRATASCCSKSPIAAVARLLGRFNRAAPGNDPTTDADVGDGLLMRDGYTLVWIGWEIDVPAPLLRIDAPPARLPAGSDDRLSVEIMVNQLGERSVPGRRSRGPSTGDLSCRPTSRARRMSSRSAIASGTRAT